MISVRQLAIVAFMALVTSGVLSLVGPALTKGARGAFEAAVYAVTAAFGMRFLAASWPSLWDSPRRPS